MPLNDWLLDEKEVLKYYRRFRGFVIDVNICDLPDKLILRQMNPTYSHNILIFYEHIGYLHIWFKFSQICVSYTNLHSLLSFEFRFCPNFYNFFHFDPSSNNFKKRHPAFHNKFISHILKSERTAKLLPKCRLLHKSTEISLLSQCPISQ